MTDQARCAASRAGAFAVRRWSIAISKTGGAPWDERMGLWQGLRRVRRLMRQAPGYGVTSIEINGRPGDGWDVDWVVSYAEVPEIASLRSRDNRREQLALLEETAREARELGLELYVWAHELYLPAGFFGVFPEAAGQGYGACTSSPLVTRLLRAKYGELLRGAPSLAGVVLSFTESGQFSLLSDRGCQCERCRSQSRAERVLAVLAPIIETCREFGRHLVVRTFQAAVQRDLWSHPELEVVRQVCSQLPSDVVLMSKYCPLDFYGTEFPHEPLIGAFSNPHLVEFSLDREWSGRTFVPVLTPVDFQRRLRHARARGCMGVVARVDFPFPEMEPEEVFKHPNEFNVFAFGRLALDPEADLETIWSEWACQRYGPEAARPIIAALKHTELITQRAFFTKGTPVISYHNMLASADHCIQNLWGKALTKWDPSAVRLTERMFRPDEEFLGELAADKDEGRQAAELALQSLQGAEGRMDGAEWIRLKHQLGKLRDTVVLFGHLEQAFFRMLHTQPEEGEPAEVEIEASPPQQALEQMQMALQLALEMECKNGYGSWPVISPDRGVTVYEFVEQLLSPALAAVTGEYTSPITVTGHRRAFDREHPPTDNDLRVLWREIVSAARAQVGRGIGPLRVEVPVHVSVGFASQHMILRRREGTELRLPIGLRVVGPRMAEGRRYRATVRRRVDEVEVSASV